MDLNANLVVAVPNLAAMLFDSKKYSIGTHT